MSVLIDELSKKIRELYDLTGELEAMYPGRHFTPDGHMVGSLGEVYAAEEYGLHLFDASKPVHDAETPDGRLVQIKATQGNQVAISELPKFLIVLKIDKNGGFTEIYNGPGSLAWEARGKKQKTSQCHIAISTLRALNEKVPIEDKLLHIGAMKAFCCEWLPRLENEAESLSSLIKAAYDSEIVVADYSSRIEGLDHKEIVSAEPAFIAKLSSDQLLGAIAWTIRSNYWDSETLENSIANGALPRLMQAWLDAQQQVE